MSIVTENAPGVPAYMWRPENGEPWSLLVQFEGSTNYLVLQSDPHNLRQEGQATDDIDTALVYTEAGAHDRAYKVQGVRAVPHSIAIALVTLQQALFEEKAERLRAEEFIRDAALPVDHDGDNMVKLEVLAEEAPYFALPDGYVVIKQSRYDALQAGFEP